MVSAQMIGALSRSMVASEPCRRANILLPSLMISRLSKSTKARKKAVARPQALRAQYVEGLRACTRISLVMTGIEIGLANVGWTGLVGNNFAEDFAVGVGQFLAEE